MLRLARAAGRIALSLALVLTACNREGNNAIDAATYGLGLTAVSGDNQAGTPTSVYAKPLVFRTVDAQTQSPVPYIIVDFTITTAGTDAAILTSEATSDIGGIVQTKVRAPSTDGVNFVVRATIRGTANYKDYQLTTNPTTLDPPQDVRLEFVTQPAAGTCVANGVTQAGQCAGVAFSTQPVVRIVDQYGQPTVTDGAYIYLTPYTTSNCAAGTVGNTGAMMPSSNPVAITTDGVSAFSGIGYQVADSTSGGPVYLQATADGLISACSSAILVKPAQANAPVFVTGTGLTAGVAGTLRTALNEMPQFKIIDSFSNGVPNYTVNFSWLYDPGTYPYGQTVTATSTTNTAGLAWPTTYRLMNATGVPGTARGCAVGTNNIVASTVPNIGTAQSAAIQSVADTPTNVTFTTNPKAGTSDQGQARNAAVQTQGVVRLRDQYNNCTYNVPNGSVTFTLGLYTDASCTTPAAGSTLASNTSNISTGVGTFSGWNVTAIPSTGTNYYVRVVDSFGGFTACGTNPVKFYDPITPIYYNTVGNTTVTTNATTGSVLLIVKDGVPTSYSWTVTAPNSGDTNCPGVPSVSGSFTGGACPATYTCSNYTPGCLGNNTVDTVRVTDGSGTTTTSNRSFNNVTVAGAYLVWSVSTPTSWGAFSAPTTVTYTLHNTGNGATGTDLAAAFSADSHFSINTDNCSGVSLPAGNTCTYVIRWDPTALPALLPGANRTGSVYFIGAPGGQTPTINFNASKL